jgi:hypothetical protein
MRATIRSIAARRGAVALGILITLSKTVVAQTPARTPNAGDRVRITRLGFPAPMVGAMVSATADSISFIPVVQHSLGAPRVQDMATIARTDVQAFEVSDGRRRHPWSGLGWGFLGGAAGGAIVGALTYEPCTSTEFLGCFLTPSSREDSALLGGAVGGVLGSAAGFIVGALYQTERWQKVTSERVSQLRLGPTSHGVAASVSLSLP